MAVSAPAGKSFRLVLTLGRAPSEEDVSAAVGALEQHGLRVEHTDRPG